MAAIAQTAATPSKPDGHVPFESARLEPAVAASGRKSALPPKKEKKIELSSSASKILTRLEIRPVSVRQPAVPPARQPKIFVLFRPEQRHDGGRVTISVMAARPGATH